MAISAPFCRFATPRLAAQAQIGGSSVAESAPPHANDPAVAHQELRFFEMRRLATLFDFRPAAILPRTASHLDTVVVPAQGFLANNSSNSRSALSSPSFVRTTDLARPAAAGRAGRRLRTVQPGPPLFLRQGRATELLGSSEVVSKGSRAGQRPRVAFHWRHVFKGQGRPAGLHRLSKMVSNVRMHSSHNAIRTGQSNPETRQLLPKSH